MRQATVKDEFWKYLLLNPEPNLCLSDPTKAKKFQKKTSRPAKGGSREKGWFSARPAYLLSGIRIP